MNNFKFWVKQNSPAILIGFGIINSAAAIVLASLATKKVIAITAPVKESIVSIHKEMDKLENGNPKKEEFKVQLRKTYLKTGKKIVLAYLPAFISFGLSVTSIIFSHKILKSRNLALAAAFTITKTGYDAYRARVREKLGNEAEEELFTGKTVTEVIEKGEDGKEKVTKVVTFNKGRSKDEDFCVIWGPGNGNYDPHIQGSLNLFILIQAEEFFNQQLSSAGYVFLNEIYERLGFTPGLLGPRKLQASHVLGWLYCPEDKSRDNYISFGIRDKEGRLTEQAKNLQLGLEDSIFLRFNVDGDILTEDGGNKAFMRVAMRKTR